MKRKVIFDIDDILWPLNEKMCEITGIDINRIIHYNIDTNPLLTEEERDLIRKTYRSDKLFYDIKWYPGIERINSIDADVYVKSNAMTQSAADIKYMQLIQVLDLPDSHIDISVTLDAYSKKIPTDTYIFIDDSPHNLAISPASHNIALNKPWNTSDDMLKILHETRLFRCNTLNDIIDKVNKLL
ncbi:hypothetical protein J6A31_09100 [bacterium]|nr:hypothetical protein [bacterium]